MRLRWLVGLCALIAMPSGAKAADTVKSADTVKAADTRKSAQLPKALTVLRHDRGRATGLPLPRYVSLKSDHARMRVGPSTDYPVRWLYTAPGHPIDIIEEFGNWRMVRDDAGASGWMHGALLSSRRTAIVAPWLKDTVALRRRPAETAGLIARMQPGVLLNVAQCTGTWCRVTVRNEAMSGYVAQRKLWGVYPREVVK
jgi:SH3-like domain-containing protein